MLRRQHEVKIDESLAQFAPILRRYAQRQDIDLQLLQAVVRAESGGNPRAVSGKNARGLMQITPIAEKEILQQTGWDKGDLFDPDYNVRIGSAYLRRMLDRFDGDAVLAVAAYNAGPTRIARLRRRHPRLASRELVARHAPRETAGYVRNVLD